MSNEEPTLQEVIDVVDELNYSLPETSRGNGVAYNINVHEGVYTIKLLGHCIWDSDNDCRGYVDRLDGPVKEDLRWYLRLQIIQCIGDISVGLVEWAGEEGL